MSEELRSSVVIPTYLRPEALQECIESLLHGAARPNEVIIVGRESDQATRYVVESVCANQASPVCFRSAWVKVPGHIPPVEAGLHLASGDLVAFVDDDVTVTDDWLAFLLRHFSDPSIGVVGGRAVVPGLPLPKRKGKPGRVSWFGKTWGNVPAMDGDQVVEVDTVMEGNCAWRRDLLRSLDLDPALNFDDAVMYGLDLCLQAKALGYRVIYDPRALAYHHVKPRVPELDRERRPPRVFSYSRNYTYIMLKRLPLWRRSVFLVWWFGIGERAAVGLATWLASPLIFRGRQRGESRSAFAGRIEGVRLWWQHRGRSRRQGKSLPEKRPRGLEWR